LNAYRETGENKRAGSWSTSSIFRLSIKAKARRATLSFTTFIDEASTSSTTTKTTFTLSASETNGEVKHIRFEEYFTLFKLRINWRDLKNLPSVDKSLTFAFGKKKKKTKLLFNSNVFWHYVFLLSRQQPLNHSKLSIALQFGLTIFHYYLFRHFKCNVLFLEQQHFKVS
jgi:hypothetical protein